MAQNQKKGMKLTNIESQQTTEYKWIIHTAIKLCAFLVLTMILMQIAGIREVCNPWIMMIPGGIFCIADGLLSKLGKRSWLYPGVFLLIVLMEVCFRNQMTEGIAVLWNQMTHIYTANTGWVLPELLLLEQGGATIAAILLIGFILAAFCSALCDYVPMLLGLAFPLMILVGSLVINTNLETGYLILALMTGILITIYHDGKKRPAKATLISWGLVLLITVAMVPVMRIDGVQEKASHISDQVHKSVHEMKYETEQTTLPEGDLSALNQDAEEDRKKERFPALLVTAEVPEVMYLRGFTGAIFDNNQWSPLDANVLAENKDVLYGLRLYAFQPDNQFEKSLVSSGKIERQQITIENTGACNQYMYVPFSLCEGSYLQAENLNTDGVLAENGRTYSYDVVTGSIESVEKTVRMLQQSKAEDVLTYRRAESKYRTFVYEQYLQIPKAVLEQMEPSWKAVAERYEESESLSLQQRQECVQTFLNLCFSPEKDSELVLPEPFAGETAFQKATVATMTLRYFGIPARYAEGYIISEKMAFEGEPGKAMEVDSSCSSAWAEVYQDGIGWIPMEIALGIEEEQRDSSGEDEDADITNGVEIEEIPKENVKLPDPTGGSRVKVIQQITLGLLKYAGVLLLLVIVLIGRRAILLKKKKKKHQDQQIDFAIGWIFADAAMLLSQMGFDRGNGSMKKLYAAVRETFDADYATMYEAVEKLNSRALFSNQSLSEEDRTSALEFHEMTKQQMKRKVKWYKRIWLKWIKCLY